MIQSMTGFSRITRRAGSETITVELRSTNHRYLELSQRLPDGFVSLEGHIAQLIRHQVRRGRIDVSVALHTQRPARRRAVLDEVLAQSYLERLRELKARFGLKGSVTLDQLLTLPHVVGVTEDSSRQVEDTAPIRQAVQAAVRELVATRQREGTRLVKDLQRLLQQLRRHIAAVRRRLPISIAQQRRRLGERLKQLVGPGTAAPQIQEALALVKDVDIHEELVRLDSHLAHLSQVFSHRGVMGKQVDFIAQELMREVNTLGAKANDALMARQVIDMKHAIEKIREQAQNLE